MKLFGRTGGHYLFWTGAVYLTAGLASAFFFKDFPKEIIQIVWISVLALPFTYPPLGRYFNLDIEWDRNMFDWFKSREERAKEYDNVVKFPAPKAVPPVPEVEPPKKEEPVTTYYRLGFTSNGRVSFQMGYSEITMNYAGVNDMIQQLEVFRDQLAVREGIDGDEE